MSTLKTINIIHPSGSTNNIVNDASGNITVGNNLTVTGTATIGGTSVVAVAPGSSGNVLTSNGTVWTSAALSLPTGSVVQAVSTTKTDTFSVASSTYTDVTGLSVSITPTSSSSKVLVMVSASVSGSSAECVTIQLVRGSTVIDVGDAAGTRPRATAASGFYSNSANSIGSTYLDSPSTTSSTTYKIQIRIASGTAYLNRTSADSDSAIYPRMASTITVMEIKG